MKGIKAFAQVVIDNGFMIPLRNGLCYDVLTDELYEQHPVLKTWKKAEIKRYKAPKDYVRRKGKEPDYSI